MQKVNIGGDRLGSGNKMEVELHSYNRSNHDLSYLWKNTQAPGTLVPFLNIIGLPGDTFDIELDSIVKTMPTIGPLFGSFKLQLDVFSCPIRLYNRLLHNNRLGLGMNISRVKFPLIKLTGDAINYNLSIPPEFQQINQSSLLAYLGIRGLGDRTVAQQNHIECYKNAMPLIAYWDIFKNYYANKQEEYAYVIHGKQPTITSTVVNTGALPQIIAAGTIVTINGTNLTTNNIDLQLDGNWYNIQGLPSGCIVEAVIPGEQIKITGWNNYPAMAIGMSLSASRINQYWAKYDIKPELEPFLLDNIDGMRDMILEWAPETPVTITPESAGVPYNLAITPIEEGAYGMNALCPQEGLAVKTYQSDLFNNWIQTEWIEGAGSIADITKISTAGGSFTIDAFQIAKKVYDMLNRVAVSGGTYEDYISAVYDHNSKWRAETPVYQGGLSKEIVFQQVISTAATAGEPLGSLAGQGTMSNKHKGGKMIINVDEPVIIMGIASITPRVDYSQGNDWTSLLKTMDDLHKPALDGIGYQDLITDQMAFWATNFSPDIYFTSAGKQPAWLNYMTAYNKSYGNFADERNQMFMTLNRRYEPEMGATVAHIKDLTTYIDPAKFNYAFAQVDLSAMNFWVQIAININARRKMSAKQIPNL